jgi:glutathione S-transferase
MKLYSGPLSLFTAKVRIALAEKGLPYQRIEVGWSLASRYEPHHPDVVALNPKRQVPVLVDGEVTVYDSTLILEYLEDRYPEPPLYPRTVPGRARCRQLEAAADEILFPWIWNLIDGAFYPQEDGSRTDPRVGEARREVSRYQEVLDAQLGGRAYLCGDFSVADIGHLIMLFAAATLGAPPPATCTHVAAWMQRVASRPSVEREMTEMAAFRASLST